MTTTTSIPTVTNNNNSKSNNNNTINNTTTNNNNNNNNANNPIPLECGTNNAAVNIDNTKPTNSMQQSSLATASVAATTTATMPSTETLTTTVTAPTGTLTAAAVVPAVVPTTILPSTILPRTECLTTPPLTNRAVTITPILNPALTLSNSQHNFSRTMQTDEDFNIKFVNLVRLHKCLYDKKVPEYRNRDNQEKSWLQISQETKESVIHCKERWRNLRACLSRYIKQQTGNDPQHKPYYLTEHMAFLLPFLKSTRNSLDGNNSLAALFQFSQQQHQQQQQHVQQQTTLQIMAQPHLKFDNNSDHHHHLSIGNQQLEVKHSLSDNEDEETIDAFDPAVTANLHMHQHDVINHHHRSSPPLSDTASANTMQNFIPDVQLSELRTPDGVVQDIAYVNTHLRRDSATHQHQHQHHHHHHEFGGQEPKRIKTECLEATTTTSSGQLHMYAGENADMEFFRSILPDIAGLTPHQKRKLKIGILELIDDVVERYPLERSTNTTNNVTSQNANASAKTRRNSSRDWRK